MGTKRNTKPRARAYSIAESANPVLWIAIVVSELRENLSDEERQTLKRCRETGEAPPLFLEALAQSIREVDELRNPWASGSITAALEGRDPADDSPKTWAYFCALFSKIDRWKLGRMVKAYLAGRDPATITPDDDADPETHGVMLEPHMWQMFKMLSQTLVASGGDYETLEIIGKAIGIDIADLEEVTARKIKEAQEAATANGEAELPGIEPPTKAEVVAQATKEVGELFTKADAEIIKREGEKLRKKYARLSFPSYEITTRPTSKFSRTIPTLYHQIGLEIEIGKPDKLSLEWRPTLPPGCGFSRISPFDLAVQNAASDFFTHNGGGDGKILLIHPEQVFRTMNGLTKTRDIGSVMMGNILESIARLRRTGMTVTLPGGIVRDYPVILDAVVERSEKKTEDSFTWADSAGKRWYYTIGLRSVGAIYDVERELGGLRTYPPALLNISAGYWKLGEIEQGKGEVSATPKDGNGWEQVSEQHSVLSTTIRDYLLLEIHRIKSTPSLEEGANKITYDAIIKYEANPELVQCDEDGAPITASAKGNHPVLKAIGSTRAANEEERKAAKRIERLREVRRRLTLSILGHFQAQGHILRFYETIEGRRKTGVVVEVDKMEKAARAIDRKEKLIAAQRRKRGGK